MRSGWVVLAGRCGMRQRPVDLQRAVLSSWPKAVRRREWHEYDVPRCITRTGTVIFLDLRLGFREQLDTAVVVVRLGPPIIP